MVNDNGKQFTSWKGTATAGYVVIFLTFGVVGGWSSITKIDRAVVAPATIAVETNRKVVQHLEGGIIREIHVHEGDMVQEGKVLFRLEEVTPRANLDLTRNQIAAALVIEARLMAERDRRDAITWPEEVLKRRHEPLIERAINDQVNQFNERRASINGQIGVLEARVEQLTTEIEGVAVEKTSLERQVAYINEELIGLRQLRSKDLIPVTRVFSMERERTRIEGGIGRATADQAKARSSIGEARLQMEQLRQKFLEEVASNIQDIRQKIGDLREKMPVVEDVLRRLEIIAPRSGKVQGLRVFTIGQVVKAGEQLLEIVPENEKLVVQAQFSPNDIDGVYSGQSAEIRFPAFQGRTLPVMMGKLESVSTDRMMDEATKLPYFLGIVSVNAIDLPEELRTRLRAGMPSEVIVASGERTVLDYFISPLRDSVRKTFIEK